MKTSRTLARPLAATSPTGARANHSSAGTKLTRACNGAAALALVLFASACKSDESRKFDLTIPTSTASSNLDKIPGANSAPPLTSGAMEKPMPAGHPAIGAGDQLGVLPSGTAQASAVTGASSAEAIAWDAPPRWKVAANTSTMRKATYSVPRAPSDDADAELSVIQAGGELQANIDRWSAQFEESPKPVRTDKTINGLKVTIVELKGTFKGGGMGGVDVKKANTTMLAAIVTTDDMPYFFKLTGGSNTVAAAKPEFDKLISSIRKR